MTGFSPAQLRKLGGKLDRSHVQSRSVEGRRIDYIEGWFALSQANAIFGFANCDRETVHFERLFERTRGEMTSCSYAVRVRVRVRAGDQTICREGTGCGTASARHPADAHERAIKAAETDATKRALATFGNRFGLCLYDKDQQGVSEAPHHSLEILTPDGQVFVAGLSPEGFCTALRKIIEGIADVPELGAWQERNAPQIARLRALAPDLKTQRGEHYADVLERLFGARRVLPAQGAEKAEESKEAQPVAPAPDDRLPAAGQDAPLAPSRIAYGPRIDKAELTFKTVRRLRDKAHLRHVATLPCLICKALPCHPHHITFAQPRGLALKVSDAFVVPLCAVHHNELHRAGAERDWWRRQGLDPLPIAARLWTESRSRNRTAEPSVAFIGQPTAMGVGHHE